MDKYTFAEWLKSYTDIKPYSVGRYSKAIGTISSELGDFGLQAINLFTLTDTAFIDTILSNPEFKKKNEKGHRMYSGALNHFKKYIEYYYDSELQAELLLEELEFEQYLTDSPNEVSKENVEDKPKGKPNHKSINNKKVWKRNPKIAGEAVAYTEYLCEIDNEHKHFISKFNQRNYVEAHHLVPMKYQDKFDCSLDIHANIVSICLICHKKIHFGLFEDKKVILNNLFNNRKERLKACGIDLEVSDLYRYYQD